MLNFGHIRLNTDNKGGGAISKTFNDCRKKKTFNDSYSWLRNKIVGSQKKFVNTSTEHAK
jgi:hypothetical protein